MSDQVAVVIGAAGGVGEEVCSRLAKAGTAVFAADRDSSVLAMVDDLGLAGGTVVDATDRAGLTRYADDLRDQQTVPTILINATGSWRIVPHSEMSVIDWAEAIDANLTAVFNSCSAFVPLLTRHSRSSIVNVGSVAGERGSVRPCAAYAAAKGGVIAYSKSLAREFGSSGLRINVVSPGAIDTNMLWDGLGQNKLSERPSTRAIAQPSEVAAAIVFLASDRSSFVTGEVLRVNGGVHQ